MTKTKNKKGEKDDETFKTILRGVETRMSANTMHGAMRIDAVSTDGYYVLQWTSEPYTLQKYKEIEDYTPLIIVCVGEMVCDAICINPVHFAKYLYTPMKTGVGDVIVRLKQV